MVSDDQKEKSSLSCFAENSPSPHVNAVIEISSDSADDASCEPSDRMRGSTSRLENRHPQPISHLENDVIELTDSDSSNSDLPDILSPFVKGPRNKQFMGPRKQRSPFEKFIPLYTDASDDEESDKDCILVLNDPPRSRKPIRIIPSDKGNAVKTLREVSSTIPLIDQDTRKGIPLPDFLKKNGAPESSEGVQRLLSKRLKRSTHEPQVQRQNYANELFVELNKDVFGDHLPKNTTLEWSKRLLTTAGRARWHRSRDGVDYTKIELASKILDCDERIRNTLSHEMCHLACWVIDHQPREGHGQLFKSWARKVMTKRPDIHISTRHNYDISYPYEWKCKNCSKIYGRYSKSIRPDECVCGACKTGKLIPLFVGREAKTPKVSRMAIANPRDSPYSMLESPTKDGHATKRRFPPSTNLDDTDILELANTLSGIFTNNTKGQ